MSKVLGMARRIFEGTVGQSKAGEFAVMTLLSALVSASGHANPSNPVVLNEKNSISQSVRDPSQESVKSLSAETLNNLKVEGSDAPGEAQDPSQSSGLQNPQAATEPQAGKSDVSAQDPSKVSSLRESEIPVFTSKESKKELASKNVGFRVGLTVLIVLGALGAVAFGLRGWMHKVRAKNPATQIKVLTQHYLGPKKSLAIIRVAGESILIGVTDQNISLIKSLALLDDDIPETTPENFKISDSASPQNDEVEVEQENFHMAAIDKMVKGRLQGIRKWM